MLQSPSCQTNPFNLPNPQSPIPNPQSTSLARSAGILSIGNIASRVLGLMREMVIAAFFGQTGLVSAFTVASQVPTMLYDFLIGGMLSAALVPVLSQYATQRDADGKRTELTRLVGALISLLGMTLAVAVLLVTLLAPQIAWLMAGGLDDFDPTLLPLTADLIRIMAPAIWLFSMAGLLTAILYALQRFTFPAIASAIYNLGIVIAAPLLAPRLGIMSLAIGVLVGSAIQFGVMALDLRRSGVGFRVQWSHPALAKIMRLYLPIAAGLLVAQAQIILDRRLASGTGAQSIAWMRSATTLQQMPLGLISVAIALAALPKLSQHFAVQDEAAYRHTLGRGLRMVLVLMIPAAVGLWLLGEPVTRLFFQRGLFTAQDTGQVVAALNIYLVGMLFAAVDFPLNYAFYARNNTLWPALVGVLSVGVYAVVALVLVQGAGFLGLVWADSAKQASHALVMLGLLLWKVGPLGARMGQGMARIGAATLLMALGIWALGWGVKPLLPAGSLGDLLWLIVAGGGGAGIYGLTLLGLGMPEAQEIRGYVGRKLGR